MRISDWSSDGALPIYSLPHHLVQPDGLEGHRLAAVNDHRVAEKLMGEAAGPRGVPLDALQREPEHRRIVLVQRGLRRPQPARERIAEERKGFVEGKIVSVRVDVCDLL